ncbi:HEPN domain-containing protein [Aquimarina longa]|uniref:HEPN domain-containing protein n=1 Tax=Aquimarina longa TaxID=1080221 RepID=UPI0007829B9E|nr:HEPN domain-containing protein [Aquimarina longa]
MTRDNYRFYNKIVERNNKLNINYKRGEKDTLSNFFNNTSVAFDLLLLVETEAEEITLKYHARKNYIINLVSSIEQFFKQLVKYDLTEYNHNIRELLKDKISLWEASKLFTEKKLKPHDIIANYYSFQNLDEIDRIISLIVSKKFLKFIGEYDSGNLRSIYEDKKINSYKLNKDYPEWRNDISELFNLRHNFVHHFSYKERISYNKLNRMTDSLHYIIMVIYIVIIDNEI